MTVLLHFVLGGLVLLVGLNVLYLLVLTVAACLNPKRRQIDGVYQGERTPGARFVVLIPAHNEELLLGKVLKKLGEQDYPATHWEMVVIADNCEDGTAAIAREAGGRVFERHDLENRGKGQALNWLMTGALRAWERPYDAVVVLDADSVVNPDFLWFMNEELGRGGRGVAGVLRRPESAGKLADLAVGGGFGGLSFSEAVGAAVAGTILRFEGEWYVFRPAFGGNLRLSCFFGGGGCGIGFVLFATGHQGGFRGWGACFGTDGRVVARGPFTTGSLGGGTLSVDSNLVLASAGWWGA
jgi:cellulose synthase/poly-beta-1,6-N-acetylglucosamine synthase-like glycosyltransferase